jgi:hypothetical protein
MEGGDATELRAAALNAIERGHLRLIIICLSPYVTKNAGIKGNQISPKEYWGSLFSLLPLNLAQAKFAAHKSSAVDVWAGSEWGAGNLLRKTYTWNDFIQHEHEESVEPELKIDSLAYRHLGDIIRVAHQYHVKVFAYFFPYNVWSTETSIASGGWREYHDEMLTLFDPARDVVWDMMGPDYASLRQDVSCYTDNHLSRAGIALELADIQRTLDQTLKGISSPPVFPRPTPYACLGSPGGGSGYDRNTVARAARASQP